MTSFVGAVSRRRVLQSVVGGAVGTGLVGRGAAEKPERHIVGTASERARRAAGRQAESVHRELGFGDIGQAVVGRFPDSALENLRDRPDVRYVEPDETVHALDQTTSWGVERIEAPDVHEDGYTGSGSDIAIIDTGIDATHEDLEANLGEGYAVTDCSTDCEESWDDDHGHGTNCAGIAGAIDNDIGVLGAAPDTTLHAVKVLDQYGSGYLSDVAAGLEWAANQGYDVGSLSLGTGSDSSTLKDACQYAVEQGVLLVAAAGNGGDCTDCVMYPAKYDTVIAVSATEWDDDLAGYSSTGPEIELAAPGTSIYTTDLDDEYVSASGTSMACPHVSGVGGLLMSGGYTHTEARERMRDTAEDIGLAEYEQGRGLVRADRVVESNNDEEEDEESEEDEETALSVESHEATDVDETSATLYGELTELEGYDDAECYFQYREAGEDEWTETGGQTLDSTSTFDESIVDLESDTDYEFRAVAEAGEDTDTDETVAFTTHESDGGDDDGGDDDDSDSEPTIEKFDLQERNAGPWTRVRAHWTVSHDDGELDTVETAVDGMGTETTSVSGDEASDHHDHRERNGGGTYHVTLTVTDTAGNTTEDEQYIDL